MATRRTIPMLKTNAIDEDLLDKWMRAKEKLTLSKKNEFAYRAELCQSMFGTVEGEFKVRVENEDIGRTVTAHSKLNRSVDWEELGIDDEVRSNIRNAVIDILRDDSVLDEVELSMLDVSFSLNMTRWRANESEAVNINDVMVETPAAPTIEVKFKD